MAQQFVPSTGQNQSFRSQQYPDDAGQNSKATAGGDNSSYAPGYEGYDRMNPPAIQQLRGLTDGGQPSKDTSSNPAATDTPAPAPAAKSTTPDTTTNLNPSTSGSIQSVPQGTAAGSSLKGAAGNALLSLGAKYATNKIDGLVTAGKNANANDTTITPRDNAQAYALNDKVQGTERTGAGTPLPGNGVDINDTSVAAPAEGVTVAAAPTPPPVTGTPLEPAADPAWGANPRTPPPAAPEAPIQQEVMVRRDPETGQWVNENGQPVVVNQDNIPETYMDGQYHSAYTAPSGGGSVPSGGGEGGGVDFSENGGYGDGGDYGDPTEGAGDYLGYAGTALNFARNGINGGTIGGTIGGAIGNALLPGIGGFIGSAIGSAVGGRVICTELRAQGLMPDALYFDDCTYAKEKLSPITARGYHWWAVSFVHLMRRSPMATRFVRPLAIWRAQDIAWRMGHGAPCVKGLVVRAIGEPICFAIGLFVAERDWSNLYEGRPQ